MKLKKGVSLILASVMVASLCAFQNVSTDAKVDTKTNNESSDLLKNYQQDSESLVFDSSAWNYDADNDVYWQIGVGYCSNPETTDYETMGIYVPGAYMTAEANDDGTYTCTLNTEGEMNGYTAETAPIVFPVNTPGYSAQAAPTSYSYDGVSSYLEAGYIYVNAGMRGRENGYDDSDNLIYSGGAPWGVTDLKAAVRYYRFNQSLLPGDTDSIFTFGHSGGGAQSALMGATGDSDLYYEYLESIGAAMYDDQGNYISDAISGAMCWCPITSLDYADEAYEWNMGQYATTGTRAEDTWTSALSDDLANAYAEYVNQLGLKDDSGNVLMLEKTSNGVYTAGTYYDYMLSVIEGSLNNFLSDTTFPYTETSGNDMGDGDFPGGDDSTTEDATSEDITTVDTSEETTVDDSTSDTDSSSTTYETAQDYIDSLNAEEEWITYDTDTNTAEITSIEAFVNNCKSASKDVGAFDDLDRGQAENNLFGNDDSESLHFDSILANLLVKNQETYATFSDWDSSIIDEYLGDLTSVDKFDNSIQERLNMYNPMYYISDYYEGFETSNVATHWRIRTGIEQGDTALTVETNLALALEQNSSVEDVDFETVWEQGHTTAERTGDSTENFIEWVSECVSQ